MSIEVPPEILPSKKLAATLRAEGYTDLRDVTEERMVNPRHLLVWRAAK